MKTTPLARDWLQQSIAYHPNQARLECACHSKCWREILYATEGAESMQGKVKVQMKVIISSQNWAVFASACWRLQNVCCFVCGKPLEHQLLDPVSSVTHKQQLKTAVVVSLDFWWWSAWSILHQPGLYKPAAFLWKRKRAVWKQKTNSNKRQTRLADKFTAHWLIWKKSLLLVGITFLDERKTLVWVVLSECLISW